MEETGEDFMETMQQNGNWIYITPIYNLEITNEIKGELKIGRVIFVDINKIPLIRKRLGFPLVFSKINRNTVTEDFFKESKTYAILSFHGIPKEKEFECREIIENAVNILSVSQLGYCSRRNNRQFGIINQRGYARNFILNKTAFNGNINRSVESKPLPFRLDKKWQEYHKDFFFFDLLFIISSSSKMQKKWKETILRAAAMSGKSMQSRDLEYSFLWNMIIVEMLLTEQGDRYSDSLPERAEAFIGWVGFWNEKKFEERIKELYKKRCQFVHDGNSHNISVEDVLFTDDLVFNLMWNIVKHIQLFPSKESIIEFSNKVKAERLLGIKSKILPKTFRFMNREMDITDLNRI